MGVPFRIPNDGMRTLAGHEAAGCSRARSRSHDLHILPLVVAAEVQRPPLNMMSCAPILSRSSGGRRRSRRSGTTSGRAICLNRETSSSVTCSPSRQAMPPICVVRHEPVFGPDAVGVEPAPDPPRQRHGVGEVEEHHASPNSCQGDRCMNSTFTDSRSRARRQETGRARNRAAAPRPGQQRVLLPPPSSGRVGKRAQVGDQEPHAEEQQHVRQEQHADHDWTDRQYNAGTDLVRKVTGLRHITRRRRSRPRLRGELGTTMRGGPLCRVLDPDVADRSGSKQMPAARLVGALGAEQHALAAGDEPLRVVGGIAADHADGERLGDVFGDRQQLRHRLERLAEVVLVEPGDDDALALSASVLQTIGSSRSKNCPSSIPTTSVSGRHGLQQPARARDGPRRRGGCRCGRSMYSVGVAVYRARA